MAKTTKKKTSKKTSKRTAPPPAAEPEAQPAPPVEVAKVAEVEAKTTDNGLLAARIAAQELRKQYCLAVGDTTELLDSDDVLTINRIVAAPNEPAADRHAKWIKARQADGWSCDKAYDPKAKTDPRMVPYKDLAPALKARETIFDAMARGVLAKLEFDLMAKRGAWTLGEGGVWAPKAAQPEHLRDDLRALPSELVTKDASDDTKAHALDEAHNVAGYAHDHAMAEIKDSQPEQQGIAWLVKQMERAPQDARVPLSQRWVDVERFHAIRGTLDKYSAQAARGDRVELGQVWHIWFDADDARKPSIRRGNPPPDIDRPAHLRGLALAVDPFDPPAYVCDAFSKVGYDLRNIMDHIKAQYGADDGRSHTPSHRAVTEALGYERYRYTDG